MRSVYDTPSDRTLDAIAAFNRAKRVNMILTNAYISAEGAKLGRLLDRLCGGAGDRHTFFANSALEALAGAVKLARHTSVRKRRGDGGWVLFVDETSSYPPFFDPLGAGPERALAPRIHFAASLADGLARIGERSWSGVVLVRTRETETRREECARLFELARAQGAMTLSCEAELDLSDPGFFAPELGADVHVFGESLAGRQVPFGCFTMSGEAYAVWNNPRDSVAHTSTFGGNSLCLTLALDSVRAHGFVTGRDEEYFARVDADMRTRIDGFAAHVNTFAATGMEMSGFALDIVEASGARLRLADGREILDCAGGGGVTLRGHNPPDLADGVLARHDPGHDYFADLERALAELTRFPRAFPAVSGATCVDVAVTLALLANAGRTRIVTFTGNFSGKTLGSMNLSKYGQQYTESDREAFRPYYFDVVYVDPFAPGAARELEALLRGGDVALVWFEVIQGMDCRPLPAPVVRLVDDLRAECGYLIGVDEVMTGGWRTGDSFLAHEKVVANSDIAVLAKPLSDATLPVGAVMVTGDVETRARAAAPDLVERLARHYRNNLAAHVALHALRDVSTEERHTRRIRAQQELITGLRELAASSRLFQAAAGSGGHVRLVLDRRWFPYHKRSQVGQLMEAAISALLLRDCGVLVMQLRFFHRIFADEAEVREVVARLKAGTRRYTPLTVYRHAIAQVVSFALAKTVRDLRARRGRAR
ncbi:aminotransferase class III-fold pyridoxal phosphate-dependent enzyme [Bailinhaonella thermotolerans]|uniref:Aminotransferase class III-fold pyridoxal phosphate-dependent enzyme n=1 Tax=Bailinhaonella thermotolerans TaxID=1070861 RepID=A0A3A4BWG2_9ACTN|nr:aminotransferase class III-fold pyridoxal phosphate-dependent enzyme [Bailinhaonella thermotolerans]RJL35928.1 aminotransferase class III-fold pyridoxal phosphate-dependent enzyme [Bailinhaonella thermotolerans]